MPRSSKIQLTVAPETRRFSCRKDESAETKFRQMLEEHRRYTEKIKVTKPEDILLDHNGLVQSRFKLTTTALTQLCSSMVPHLSAVIQDISGLRPRSASTAKAKTHDVDLAIRLLNDMIKLRFSALKGFALIVDHQRLQVEGVVGRKYEFLSNGRFYRRVGEFISRQFKGDHEFSEAVISGRRVFVRFQGPLLFSVPSPRAPEPFLSGLHFANSEVGECSVRACAAVIRKWCDNKAISPFLDGGALPHYSGPKFDERFRDLLDRVRIRAKESESFADEICRMKGLTLGLGGDKKSHDKRFTVLQNRLRRSEVSAAFAEKALRRAMYHGSYPEDAVVRGEDLMATFSGRTAYDLFNAVTHEAKSRALGERESAEQLAYLMLLRKFNWK